MNKTAFTALLLAAAFISIVYFPVATASGINASTSQNSGVFVTTSTPAQDNVSLTLLPGTNGSIVFPEWTFWIYGNTTYKIYIDGLLVQEGVNLGTGTFHYNFAPGEHNVTVFLGQTAYNFKDVHIIYGIATQPYQTVYVESTYPGVNQQLIVYSNQTGIVTYAHMKIQMISSTPTSYKIYVDSQFYQSGNISTPTYYVPLFENTTSVSVTVYLGGKLYNFDNMPIAKVPLQQKKTSPQQKLIYTQLEQDILQVRLYIAAIMSLAVSLLAVGTVGKSYIDTRIRS